MPQQPDPTRHSDVLNQVVLDRRSLQELGQVEVLWTYPQMHRVLGFICRSGWLGAKKTAFNLDQLDAIGVNGVLVNSKPVDTDADKVRQIESLVGWEVWTDNGERAGKIIDYLFDLETGDIEHYLFTSNSLGGMAGTIFMLPSNYILSFGNRRVLVPAGALRSFALYREGIQEKFSKVTELFKEEKSQLTQDMRSLLDQARERAKLVAEQAREKAKTVAERVDEFIDDIDLDETPSAPVATPSTDPAPWDDWDSDLPKPPVQSPPRTVPQPPRSAASEQSSEKSSDDPWDDDSW
ncbi:PRC-barrel domain-containing protein [Myxacorys almedinensis]|uniref:Photosystem reaction center subunit H n=1 Tax=Myxacorys almedinensis A TaxID=2690445 RepID=A0A8J7YZL0_9CYAN|nr:PRC-barrel domain-containing protein [Myxacorys almedinensis]NDJ16974.1 photosystem reaction center subunit H [Myxacorys almedinensis A]